MDKLKKRIQEEAKIIRGRIIKVDHFINHMVDTELLFEMGKEFADKFPNATKILTIEASGIAVAVATSYHLNNIPVVFGRKTKPGNIDFNLYTSEVFSFTKEVTNSIVANKEYLKRDDNVLILDDFLATGNAALGLIDICHQAGANIIGAGFIIEKGFQFGRDRIVNKGISVYSLANIASIKHKEIQFNGN